MPEKKTLGRDDIARLLEELEIDRSDLDTCLVKQPSLFYRVAEGLALATSRRDTRKLELDEETARTDLNCRALAAVDGEKYTEALMSHRVRATDGVNSATRAFYRAKEEADRWAALKEAFQQRSFMLREIVAMQISEFAQLSSTSVRGRLGDANAQEAERMRRQARDSLR